MSDLGAAIMDFRVLAEAWGWDTQDGATNACDHASNEFLHHLERLGISDAEIEHFDGELVLDRHDYPWILPPESWHWAVRVGDTLIDWTARQFDETAPFPAIWIARRREWRNCS
jgi:hypothetical protein